MSEKLPPLPPSLVHYQSHSISDGCWIYRPAYTAEQVEEIRRQTIEHCAKVCEQIAQPTSIQGAHPDYLEGRAMGVAICSHEIRALLETPHAG